MGMDRLGMPSSFFYAFGSSLRPFTLICYCYDVTFRGTKRTILIFLTPSVAEEKTKTRQLSRQVFLCLFSKISAFGGEKSAFGRFATTQGIDDAGSFAIE